MYSLFLKQQSILKIIRLNLSDRWSVDTPKNRAVGLIIKFTGNDEENLPQSSKPNGELVV